MAFMTSVGRQKGLDEKKEFDQKNFFSPFWVIEDSLILTSRWRDI
jgi:hypothetical protein